RRRVRVGQDDGARGHMTDGLLNVPEAYRGGLERYARDHVEPGSFLLCVLEDRLGEALARFDHNRSIEELREVVEFVHNELMPGSCHGSPEAVKAWLAHRGACAAV